MLGLAREKKTWSARSQKSLLRQIELEAQLARAEDRIAFLRRTLAELETAKERKLQWELEGDHASAFGLGETLQNLHDATRQLESFTQAAEALRLEIERLKNPTPAELAERAEMQNSLATLAGDRDKKSGAIEKALQDLRRLLEDRAGLTGRMRQLGESLDLTISDWDEQEYEKLLAALPEQLAPVSREWTQWLRGRADSREVQTVKEEFTVYPETLADAGVRFTSGQGGD